MVYFGVYSACMQCLPLSLCSLHAHELSSTCTLNAYFLHVLCRYMYLESSTCIYFPSISNIFHRICFWQILVIVKPRFNEPLFSELLGITNNIFRTGKSYSKMYGTEPRFNEPQFYELLDLTNGFRQPHLKFT